MSQRLYLLVDCNNFFVSCERVFRPELENRPVAVLSHNDGCIIARSNELKALGVPMGAPVFKYRDLLRREQAVLLSSTFSLYGEMSRRVVQILEDFCPNIEVYSVDEAFLQIDDLPIRDVAQFARQIRDTIKQWTGLPVGVGIGPTKTLAKAATTLAKKEAKTEGILDLGTINDRARQAWLQRLPIGDVWGIGFRLAPRLSSMGIKTAYDYATLSQSWVGMALKTPGLRTYLELNGQRCFELSPIRKGKQSIAVTRTFEQMKDRHFELEAAIASFTARASHNLRRQNSVAGHITTFVETNRHREDLGQYRNAATEALNVPTAYTPALINASLAALGRIFRSGYQYKRAGIICTSIAPFAQNSIVEPKTEQQFDREAAVNHVIDEINNRWGKRVIRSGAESPETFRDPHDLRPKFGWGQLPTVKV